MKVVTTQISAGPSGILHAGKVVNVPDAFGRHLIAAEAARAAGPDDKVNAEWPHGTAIPAPTGGATPDK